MLGLPNVTVGVLNTGGACQPCLPLNLRRGTTGLLKPSPCGTHPAAPAVRAEPCCASTPATDDTTMQRFEEAVRLTGGEFLEAVQYYAKVGQLL